MKRFLKFLTISAAIALIAGAITCSARRAIAQDSNDGDADTGSWYAPGADSADEATTPDSKPPISLTECWEGDVSDKADGSGEFIFFEFIQDENKITSESQLEAEWTDASFEGPISGKVSSKGITFKGSAGTGCPFHGSARGDDTELDGKITFGGKCAKSFKKVRFSISPTICG